MPAMDPEILDRWRTLQIVDRDGGTVGSISEFYLDLETRYPTWALVNTGLFGARQSFVPLLEAMEISDGLKVPYEKGHIKDAPHIDPRGELTPDEEATLCAHYGIDYRPAAEATADEATAAEATAAEATADEATAGEPFADEATAGAPAPAEPTRAVAGMAGPGPASAEPEPATDDRARDEPTLATPYRWAERGEGEPAAPDRRAEDEPAPPAGGPRPVPVADEVAWPASPPPPGPLAEPPAEPPPAAGDAERPREPDEAAEANEEPSMLERARRRFEGFVSGGGPATPDDRDARDR
jgi:PRC-barrel domain